jgi:hypothetical protein
MASTDDGKWQEMAYNSSDLLPEPREPPVFVLHRRSSSRGTLINKSARSGAAGSGPAPGSPRAPRNGRWKKMLQEIEPSAVVDCTGLYCPMPIAMTKEGMEMIAVGEVLMVEADDPAAERYQALGEQDGARDREVREGGRDHAVLHPEDEVR